MKLWEDTESCLPPFDKKLKMKYFIVFISFAVIAILPSMAQNFEEDMKVALSYSNKTKVVSEIQHTVYSIGGTTPLETNSVSLIRNGKFYRSLSYGTEQICNDKYNIIINHNSKIVFVRSSNPKEMHSSNPANEKEIIESLNSFSQLMEELASQKSNEMNMSNIHYLGVSHGQKVYNVEIPFGLYEKAEFYFSKRNGMLEKSIYYTRDAYELSSGSKEKVKLIAVSKKFKTKGRIKKSLFSMEDIFIINQDNQVTLLGKYKDYTPIVEL